MSKRAKTWFKAAMMTAAMLSIMTQGAAKAVVYEERAAINEEGNETTSFNGTSRTKQVDSSHPSSGSNFILVQGMTYTIQAAGRFSYEGSLKADAECTAGQDGRWVPRRLTDSSGRDTWDLSLTEYGRADHQFDWTPVLPYTSSAQGDPACSSVNRYTATFTKSNGTNDVYLFVVDDWAGNTGSLSVTLSRGPFEAPRKLSGTTPYQCGKRSGETWRSDDGTVGEIQHAQLTIDSRTPTDGYTAGAKDSLGGYLHPWWYESGFLGIYTCNWALPGSVYKIIISGTWSYDTAYAAPFAQADAACTTGTADTAWLPNRYPADPLYPVNTWSSQDTMDAYVDSRWVAWQPNKPFPSTLSQGCSSDHTYVLPAYSPVEAGPVRIQIADWAYQTGNNQGQLQITIEKIS